MEKALRKHLPKGKFENVSQKRSAAMAAVKGKNNKTTEMKLRYSLVSQGISGWKLHDKGVPGRPDFHFPQNKLVIFVDGCFWHGCPKCGHIPKKNSEFWKAKIQRNRERDKNNTRKLKKEGFQVLRFWEHELKDSLEACINTINKKLIKT